MYLYFLIDPMTFAIVGSVERVNPLGERNLKTDAAHNGKPYTVDVSVVKPAHDPGTEILEGPVDVYDEPSNTATRTYTKRAKTQAELDAEQLATDIAFVEKGLLKVANSFTLLARVLVTKGVIDPQTDFDQSARDDFIAIENAVNRVTGR